MLMKKSLFIMSVLALLVPGLSGCQREMTEVEARQTKQLVNASFAFNISRGTSAATKQTAANVQEGGNNFKGIVDAYLMTLATGDAEDGNILYEDKTADEVYDLSSLVAAAAISPTESRRVLPMSFELNTNKVILYGKAPKIAMDKTSSTDLTLSDKVGSLATKEIDGIEGYNVSKEKGKTFFQLGNRLGTESRKAAFKSTEKLLAGILTVVMNSSLSGNEHVAISDEGFVFKKDVEDYTDASYAESYVPGDGSHGYPNIYWSMYDYDSGKSPLETGHSLYPIEKQLAFLYKEMTGISPAELRAGSGQSILNTVTDMWTIINSLRAMEPLSAPDAIAKQLAITIDNHLLSYFNVSTHNEDGGPVTGVSFKTVGSTTTINSIIKAFSEDNTWPSSGTADAYKPVATDFSSIVGLEITNDDLKEFPVAVFNMPRGVAYLKYNEQYKFFYYDDNLDTSAMVDENYSSLVFSYDSYYYPAEILYFGNSPVVTSDESHGIDDYPKDTDQWANWGSGTKWTSDWTGSHVTSKTRSVAMKYDVNYGVAMLETKLGYSDDVYTGTTSGILYDNNHKIQEARGNEEDDREIAVTGTSFQLAGLVIGGQPQRVGWDFLPIKTHSEDAAVTYGFIYDRHIANPAIPYEKDGNNKPVFSSPNYTVVFDNYVTGVQDDQHAVYVALEFINNSGMDFYGNANLIKDGDHFYLIGKIDPNNGYKKEIDWPDNYEVPPYETTGANKGKSKKIRRVFIQDYMTSVTFKFGPHSLKYAYITVPDLKASSITMGLSVDVQWSTGLVYEEIIIGGGDPNANNNNNG